MDDRPRDAATDDVLDADAYLLDVDGTLVDSNYLHVMAWQQALRDTGDDAPAAFIHRAIGLDAQKLLDAITAEAPKRQRDRIIQRHADHYEQLAPRLRTLPGARDLLRALHERGVRVVLATSAPQSEVDRLLATLDADDWIDEVTTGEDVSTAKPEPELFDVAVERAGVRAARCLAVGDARWDMIAAGRAGITAVGVETGGTARETLVEAGAAAVYATPRELLDHLSARDAE